jgi:tRNA threonylcarbamoyladenosine biosynthesis protein TsaB
VIVLSLDTCLSACSAAVLRDGALISAQSEPMTRGHQERLAPLVRDTMSDAGLAFADLDRIGVTVGPGSFTGLRVGLAFAKGLALALDRPCVGVGTLEALAAGIEGVTAAVIDAGRGNLYLQIFEAGAALTAPDILSVADATARLIEVCGGRDLTLVGPGAHLLVDAAPAARLIALDTPSPETVARLVAKASLAPATPLYLRPPDALPKAARVAV